MTEDNWDVVPSLSSKLSLGHEALDLVFDSPPQAERCHFFDGGLPAQVCTGEGCQACAAGNRPALRFIFNVESRPEKTRHTLILTEKGARLLKKLRTELGADKFSKSVISCARLGEKFTTEYRFNVVGPAGE